MTENPSWVNWRVATWRSLTTRMIWSKESDFILIQYPIEYHVKTRKLFPYLLADLCCRFSNNSLVDTATSDTAFSNTATFFWDGSRYPLTLRTYWRAAARISLSSGKISGLRNFFIDLHIRQLYTLQTKHEQVTSYPIPGIILLMLRSSSIN